MKLILFKRRSKFYWHIKGRNGEIKANHNQGYERRGGMMKALNTMWAINANCTLVQIRGDWYPVVDLTRGKKDS